MKSLILLTTHYFWITLEVQAKSCETQSCLKEAKTLIDSLNTSVDPCDNFYEFACGNFKRNISIPEDKTRLSHFDLLEDKISRELFEILSRGQRERISPRNKAFDFYDSCISEEEIERLGSSPLLEKLEPWPIFSTSTNPTSFPFSNSHWTQSLFKLVDNGFSGNILMALIVGPDLKNSSRRMIFLDQPVLGLDEAHLRQGLNDSFVQAYFELMVKSAEYLAGNSESSQELKKEMANVLHFEMSLAHLKSCREERKNLTRLANVMRIQDLKFFDSSFHWLTYIQRNFRVSIATLTEFDLINVSEIEYLKKLFPLLSQTSSSVLYNYIHWRAVKDSLEFLSKDAQRIYNTYLSRISGRISETPRWKKCVSRTVRSLTGILGSLYVKEHFSNNSKSLVESLMKDIRSELRGLLLSETNWMETSTRKEALRKLSAMKTNIGFPSELLDESLLEDFYKDLKVESKDYFSNVLRVREFNLAYQISQLRNPINKTHWLLFSQSSAVNAYYSPSLNVISFPAGILSGVFFSTERRQFYNIGAIGFVMGHEMTHGFDDSGRQFDEGGNLRNWWNNETEKAFRSKAECMVNQYNNYSFPTLNLRVNGRLTLGENIADNGALKVAYRAYLKWKSEHMEEEFSLPGLNYTEEQYFWLGAAQVWCSKIRDKTREALLRVDSHAPEPFRVIGSFSNSKDFARDFNCPINSPMNPINKCSVW